MRRISLLIAAVIFFAFLAGSILAAPTETKRIDLTGTWKFSTDPYNKGVEKGWHKAEFDSSSWRNLSVPGYWEEQGVTESNPTLSDQGERPYNGYAWYRRSVVIPNEWKGKSVILNLGKINDNDWSYVNGELVGTHAGTLEDANVTLRRTYVLPSSIIKFGQANVIAVKAQDLGGHGGIYQGPISITVDDPDKLSEGSAGSSSGSDAVNIGGNIFVKKGRTVASAIAPFGNVTVEGHVTGDAVAPFGTVTVLPGGRVDGSAIGVFGATTLHSGSKVGGDVVAVGGSLQKDDGAEVGGGIVSMGGFDWSPYRWFHLYSYGPGFELFHLLAGLFSTVLFALIAMLIAALFPKRIEMVAEIALTKPGASALYGIIAPLLFVPLAVALFVTCVGAPLIIVEIALYILGFIFGKMGIGLALGRRLAEAMNQPNLSVILAVAIGTIIIGVIRMVPFVGWLVAGILDLIGFGAVLITGFGANEDWWKNRQQKKAAATQIEQPIA